MLTPYAGRSDDGFRVRRDFGHRPGWFVELHAFGFYIGLARQASAVDRCAWDNDGGSVGCCLDDGHESAGVTHCPHVHGELTSIPRELIRRTDGRNVACVRVLNTRIDDGATRDPA